MTIDKSTPYFPDLMVARIGDLVKKDDYEKSMALLAIDNVRMKADIIQLRDELKRQKENWVELCEMNIRISQQSASIKDFKKNLLTTQIVFGIFALSAAIAAFI